MRGRGLFTLAAIALALLAAPAIARADYQMVTRDVYVPMDDGVRLAVTLGLPSNDGATPAPGRFPVILTMTPYSRQAGGLTPKLVGHGYVHAVADIRGAGGSEGNLNDNYFSPREQRDGYDLVEWLGTQPFSTGKVGMAGGSYLGIIQYLTAEQRPPHLAAIAPAVALSDLYREATYHGGILSQFFDGAGVRPGRQSSVVSRQSEAAAHRRHRKHHRKHRRHRRRHHRRHRAKHRHGRRN
jgi:putative CocE/NonD family hydrolase